MKPFINLPVTSVQCIVGTERDPDNSILLKNDDDDYFQGFGRNKEVFRGLTKDDNFIPFISDNDFRSSDCDTDIG